MRVQKFGLKPNPTPSKTLNFRLGRISAEIAQRNSNAFPPPCFSALALSDCPIGFEKKKLVLVRYTTAAEIFLSRVSWFGQGQGQGGGFGWHRVRVRVRVPRRTR